jgi:hypothetical protein
MPGTSVELSGNPTLTARKEKRKFVALAEGW